MLHACDPEPMATDNTQEFRPDRTQQLPRTVAVRQTRRIAVGILGGFVLALGVALSLPGIPGPGLLVLFLGLTILSWEFRWARRMLFRLKARVRALKARRRQRR